MQRRATRRPHRAFHSDGYPMKPHVKLKLDGMQMSASVPADLAPTPHHGASISAYDVTAWQPKRGSADADLLPNLNMLVGRSRDIERNNGVAKGGLQTIVDNVVGTGLRLSSRPDYKALGKTIEWADEWGRQYESMFHAWWWTTACHAGDTMTGDQLTAQQFSSQLRNGEFVALPLWLPERGDGYSTKLQTIEPDRLSQPDGQMESVRFRGGIEFDVYGAPTAYHFKRTHPGDPYYYDDAGLSGWERVPRRTPFGRLRVIHGFNPERSGQSRGKPLLTSILPQFKQLDRYVNAEIMAAVVNAMVAMTIETPLDNDSIVELFAKDRDAYMQARQDHAVRIQSGGLMTLFPGDKASAFLPSRPASGFGAFCENIYRIIGVGLDIPYELLMKDFSKTNYSSARAAMLEAWRSFNRQRDWLGTQWMDPVSCLFLEEMVNAGRIEAPGFYENRWAYQRCKWIGPGRGWVDPVKEADASVIRLGNNLSTLEQECAEQGLDWEEVLEQRARENAKAKLLGVDIAPPQPRATTTPYPSDEPPQKGERVEP